MEINKTKKVLVSLGSILLLAAFIGMLTAPEISDYFKYRGLPSDRELKAMALEDFQKHETKRPTDEDELKFEETGNLHFPYLINYRYSPNNDEIKEKLYLYSDDVNAWVVASESTWSFEGGDANEVDHSSVLLR